MKIFRKGFNYSQDGPGNRLVYHLQGCNYRCKWCSNPEGMGAISENCMEYTPEEVCREAVRSKMMFFGGGGVTFTGGEPTMQFGELKEVLQMLKNEGIHTAIETNASHPALSELLPWIDHFIMDFKHFDSAKHQQWIGCGNEQVKKNLEMVCSMQREALIHIPLVNGFNNDPEGFVEYFDTLNTAKLKFEILPYHEYGKEKWTLPYEVKNGFVTAEDIQKFNTIFTAHGLTMVRT